MNILLNLGFQDVEQTIREADGLVLAYSITDASSIDVISQLFQQIKLRRSDDVSTHLHYCLTLDTIQGSVSMIVSR